MSKEKDIYVVNEYDYVDIVDQYKKTRQPIVQSVCITDFTSLSKARLYIQEKYEQYKNCFCNYPSPDALILYHDAECTQIAKLFQVESEGDQAFPSLFVQENSFVHIEWRRPLEKR